MEGLQKNTLVLGGAGYIGSHAVAELSGEGYSPVVVDNLSTGHRQAVGDTPFYQTEISDKNALEKIIKDHQITSVMHFAASALVGESVKDPLLYFKNNVSSAIDLFDVMVRTGVKNVIFSSTAAVYGEPLKTPIEEDHPLAPINPYGESKLSVEKLLGFCAKAYGITYVCFRYFNAAGAHKDAHIGELHRKETHLIPIILKAALGEVDEVNVYGTDYDTPDGTCVRDYVHVTDLIKAHVTALDYLRSGNESAIFNLGNGKGFSVREVIDTAKHVCGREIPFIDKPRRDGDPAVLVADAKKAHDVLGWYPEYTELSDIIKSAWEWHKWNRQYPW